MIITIEHLDNGFKHTFNTVLSAEKFLNTTLKRALLRLKNKDADLFGEDKNIHIYKNHYKTNFILSYE